MSVRSRTLASPQPFHWPLEFDLSRSPLLSNFSFTYIYIYIPFFFPLLVFNLSFLHPFIRSSIRLFRRASSRSNRTWPLFRLLFPFSFLFFFFEPRLLLLARRADYTNVQLPPSPSKWKWKSPISLTNCSYLALRALSRSIIITP